MAWVYQPSVGHGSQARWVDDATGAVSYTDPTKGGGSDGSDLSVTTSDGQVRNEPAGGGTGIFATGGPNGEPVMKAPVDNSGVYSKDEAASRDLLAGLLNKYNNYQGQAAPTAGYADAGQAAQSAPVDWGSAAVSQGAGPITASTVAPMTFGGPMSAGAASSGAAAQAQASAADLVNIDKTDSNEVRARQLALADALTGAMNGQGPSVAQQQLSMGLDQALQQQAAIAASSRGQNVGLGQYNAAITGGQLAAQTNAQAALQRAQEIATARGQLNDVLGATRGQDIGLATNQAGFANASNQFNAGQKNNVGMFNAGQQNENQRMDAQLGTQAAIQSMMSGNSYNAQMNALAQALAIQNGQWAQDTNLHNSDQLQQNNQFNAGQQNTFNTNANQAALQNQQFNTGQSNQFNMDQAQMNQGVNLANLGSALQTQGLNQQGQNALLASLLTGQGQLLGADASIYGTQQGSATQTQIAQMQADLAKYLQSQKIDDENSFHWKDAVNGAVGLGGVAAKFYGA